VAVADHMGALQLRAGAQRLSDVLQEQRHRLGFDGGDSDDLRRAVGLCAVTL